jgi:hypothetical protein
MARGAGHLLRRLFPKALGRSPLVTFARSRVRGELRQVEDARGEALERSGLLATRTLLSSCLPPKEASYEGMSE